MYNIKNNEKFLLFITFPIVLTSCKKANSDTEILEKIVGEWESKLKPEGEKEYIYQILRFEEDGKYNFARFNAAGDTILFSSYGDSLKFYIYNSEINFRNTYYAYASSNDNGLNDTTGIENETEVLKLTNKKLILDHGQKDDFNIVVNVKQTIYRKRD